MADIEQKNAEVGAWWWVAEKTDYSEILWWKKQEIWGKQTAEEKNQADKLIQQLEWEESKKTVAPTQEAKKPTQRNDGQTWKKENPGEVNVKRVDAGKNIIDDVNKPQTNIVAKGLQRVIKKLGWF
jgi:hypothetical protein